MQERNVDVHGTAADVVNGATLSAVPSQPFDGCNDLVMGEVGLFG
jgi:hypothetical protein